MDRRTIGAMVGLVVVGLWVVGLYVEPWLAGILQAIVLGVLGLAFIILAAHQFVQWRDHRLAIELAVILIGFAGGLVWLLSPVRLTSDLRVDRPLTSHEAETIRGGAILLLVVVGLSVSWYLREMDPE